MSVTRPDMLAGPMDRHWNPSNQVSSRRGPFWARAGTVRVRANARERTERSRVFMVPHL